MIRLHVLAIPHTVSTKEYTVCAFTQKVINFCKMFKEEGMHVIHYGHEHSEVVCDEHVTVMTDDLYKKVYGHHDWKSKGLIYDEKDEVYQTFHKNAIREIGLRKQPGDFILCFFGYGHKPVCDAHPDLFCVEPSIGYGYAFAPYKVYESYAVMHGLQGPEKVTNAEYKFYDAVIPSGFDLSEFEYREEKQDYFLMVGRLGWHKGVDIAAQVTEAIGAKLILAGTTYGPHDCNLPNGWPAHVEYVGYADVEKRKKLMAGAKGLFCPTIYNEPFGYVAIEAMLSGTPIITTDWGAFTETVQHGATGYRCRTFEQFVWAAKNIDTISPAACRSWAEQNYNMKRVGKMYREYFEMVGNLRHSTGWYTPNPERKNLDWLVQTHPTTPKTFREVLNLLNSNQNGKIHLLQIGAMDGFSHDELYTHIQKNDWSGDLIEPLPDMFGILKQTYHNKPKLRLHNLAISESDGLVKMYRVDPEKIASGDVPQWSDGCSTMTPETHIEYLRDHMIEVEVVSKTFKSFAQQDSKNTKYDLIQIDTEGYDYKIYNQIMQYGLRPKLFKIEIAHITFNTAKYMQWELETAGYKTFIDNYDLIAYRM